MAAPPKLVDRLVVVADDHDVPVLSREQLDQLGLGSIRVLELIHQHVAVPALQLHPSHRRFAEQAQGQAHLIAEVDEAGLPQERLVPRVRSSQLPVSSDILLDRGKCIARGRLAALPVPGPGLRGSSRQTRSEVQVRLGPNVLVLAAAEKGRHGAEEARGIAQRPVFVQVEGEEPLAQEDHDLGPGQHAQIRRQAELERELADQPIAERVEGGDRRVRVAVRDELVDPNLHLVGGLVREGQGQDLRGPGPPGGDQPGDPAGDHLGLAGARPGDHQERPSPWQTARRCSVFRPESRASEPSLASASDASASAASAAASSSRGDHQTGICSSGAGSWVDVLRLWRVIWRGSPAAVTSHVSRARRIRALARDRLGNDRPPWLATDTIGILSGARVRCGVLLALALALGGQSAVGRLASAGDLPIGCAAR